MFTASANVYDQIYESFHDFAAEAARLRALIRPYVPAAGATLLDVACGTGAYLVHLRGHFAAEGLDLDPAMLAVVRRKLPDVPLHQGDMAEFELGRRFDAVVCLGSSIGYAKTLPRLRQTLRTLARHVRPGGVVVVEPWFAPEAWEAGRLTTVVVEQPALKIARMSVSGVRDRVSLLDFHYLVGRPDGIEHIVECHEMGLFTHEDYLAAFGQAGLAVAHDPAGLIGRGLYWGINGGPADQG